MSRMCRSIVSMMAACMCCAGWATASLAADDASTASDASTSSEPAFIAGTTPDHRPANAPVITTAPPLRPDALHGISRPYPPSIEAMLKDQGAWYTPFIRPGMNGRYDIRGWH